MTSTPTKTVRLSVPVTPEIYATFQRLSEASGLSMAASLGKWLVDTQQAAELMADNIRRFRSSPSDMVTRLRLHTASLEDFAEQAIQDAMDRADEVEYSAPGGAPLAGIPGRAVRSKTAKTALTPPVSNTGGKGTKPRAGKPVIQAYADTNGLAPKSSATAKTSNLRAVK